MDPGDPGPVVVLGVHRSGTRLLKEMLTAHSKLAIPPESYFLPAISARHGRRVRREPFVADLQRFKFAGYPWTSFEEVRRRLPAEADLPTAIDAVYRAYAEGQGKARYGDKTPEYMQDLELLERAFPHAQYVHIVRDGRNAALSWVSMPSRRSAWRWPGGQASFAHQWRREIAAAQRFGSELGARRYHELRYEDLAAEPETTLRSVCAFLRMPFEPGMLEYRHRLGTDEVPNHPRLLEPPGPEARDWRRQMEPREVECFEAMAGDTLTRLGYERAFPSPAAGARARARVLAGWSTARIQSWRAFVALHRRTFAWRLRPV